MAAQQDITMPLNPDQFYHIFNRGNGGQNIFYQEKNYTYFLEKYKSYMLDPVLANGEIAPDLLNFQNLVNLTPEKYTQFFKAKTLVIFKVKLLQWIVSERFRRFLLAYAKAINVQENRKGSLFQKLFRRKSVTSAAYLSQLVLYLHRNPVHHGRAITLTDWKWTSYDSFTTKCITSLKKTEVLAWFNGKAAFIQLHKQHIDDWLDGQKWIIEED